MKISQFGTSALFAGCVAIAACSQAPVLSHFGYTPSVNAVHGRGAGPSTYRVLYNFNAQPDGIGPRAGLFNVNTSTLYGTTEYGGKYYRGDGTVFSITTGGTEKVLHSFGKGTDGISPAAPLTGVSGTLYGTTAEGGAHSCGHYYTCGTIFSITTGGTEKVLHSFGNGTDGSQPVAGLIDVGGRLYGTTYSGGVYGYGTVFSITTGGAEKVLHSFGKGTDGSYPQARLSVVGAKLYGTTGGGGSECVPDGGCGTVFSITTGGTEKVLHNFGKGTDGIFPLAPLINVNGTLYGTTQYGGADGYGTVFTITTGGAEKVLHSFEYGTDGFNPVAGLTEVNGTLYGTTEAGGAYYEGTIFSMTTGGTENVLHSFGNGTDGVFPLAGLHDVGGTLYGTTVQGGANAAGTVFSLTP